MILGIQTDQILVVQRWRRGPAGYHKEAVLLARLQIIEMLQEYSGYLLP